MSGAGLEEEALSSGHANLEFRLPPRNSQYGTSVSDMDAVLDQAFLEVERISGIKSSQKAIPLRRTESILRQALSEMERTAEEPTDRLKRPMSVPEQDALLSAPTTLHSYGDHLQPSKFASYQSRSQKRNAVERKKAVRFNQDAQRSPSLASPYSRACFEGKGFIHNSAVPESNYEAHQRLK